MRKWSEQERLPCWVRDQTVPHLLKATARYFDGMKPEWLSIRPQGSRLRFSSSPRCISTELALVRDWQDQKQDGQKSHPWSVTAKIENRNFGRVRIFSIIKTIQSCGIFSRAAKKLLFSLFFLLFTHFCVELVPLDKATFSGQDEVRTSNLLHLSWDFLHSGLMFQQLSHLTDWKFINFLSHNIFVHPNSHILASLPHLFSQASAELVRRHFVYSLGEFCI